MTLSRFASPLEKQDITGGGAVFTFPSANADAIREAILVDFVSSMRAPRLGAESTKKLLELLDPCCVFRRNLGESQPIKHCSERSDSREILEAVRRANGTRCARIELVEDGHEIYDRLHETMQKKLTSLQIAA
jgi:hypothetical protein